MRTLGFLAAVVVAMAVSGCVMFDVGVANPVNGLTTVAVAPFFNLSEERTVDGRRFAQAYFTELQKTPGFQVVPVGVVEQAIFDNKLEMNSRDDALKLAEILHVDAVVVGAVTDYSPYYPPRIGLQVSWYSPREWTFAPGMSIYDNARQWAMPRKKWSLWPAPVETEACQPGKPVVRMQSPDDERRWFWMRWFRWNDAPAVERPPQRLVEADPISTAADPAEDVPPPPPAMPPSPEVIPDELPALAPPPVMSSEPVFQSQLGNPNFDPRLPLMSYTRMFDGSDPQLTARLRDHVELSADLRSGGWQAYLSRSDDFIKFTAHLMVVEMLQLHGGEAKRRVVVKARRYR